MGIEMPAPEIPFPPMEAELVRELPEGEGWQYEPKWDGFRGLLENVGGELALWSRKDRPLLRYFPELRALGDQLPARSIATRCRAACIRPSRASASSRPRSLPTTWSSTFSCGTVSLSGSCRSKSVGCASRHLTASAFRPRPASSPTHDRG